MSKILWVDDDIDNPELSPDLDALKENGHEITPISNTTDFIKLLENTKTPIEYDCVIIDMMMPPQKVFDLRESEYGGRTGFLLIDKLKENKCFKTAKIVVYSIVDDEEMIERCSKLDIPVLCLDKSELLSDEFVKEIENIITQK